MRNFILLFLDAVLGTEKRSAIIFGKAVRPKLGFREMDKKALISSRISKFPRITEEEYFF